MQAKLKLTRGSFFSPSDVAHSGAAQTVLLPLYDMLTHRTTRHHALPTAAVQENTHYHCSLLVEQAQDPITQIELFLGGITVGTYQAAGEPARVSGSQELPLQIRNVIDNGPYQDKTNLFLLHYDLLKLQVKITTAQRSVVLVSDDFVCLPRNPRDEADIKAMFTELMASTEVLPTGLMTQSASPTHEQPLPFAAYVDMAHTVCRYYRELMGYFKLTPHHKLSKQEHIVPYQKLQQVTPSTVSWLAKNLSVMSKLPPGSAGVTIGTQQYMPQRVQTHKLVKNLNTYENSVVLGLLLKVLATLEKAQHQLTQGMNQDQAYIDKLEALSAGDTHPPILLLHRWNLEQQQRHTQTLDNLSLELKAHYRAYQSLFPGCATFHLERLPHKTKVFQELAPYGTIYELAHQWAQIQTVDLEKEGIISRTKTLDKVFELYSLVNLLKLLQANGFTFQAEHSKYHFDYTADTAEDTDIANTYALAKGDVTATLYYEPVIYDDRVENQISLFRARKGGTLPYSYVTPDFVLKLAVPDKAPVYLIFDAKFRQRRTIKKYQSLEHAVTSYFFNLASMDYGMAGEAIKAVVLLQGRRDDSLTPAIEPYYNSPLVDAFNYEPFLGVIAPPQQADYGQYLWPLIDRQIQALEMM